MSKYHINVTQNGAHAASVIGDQTQLITNFSTTSSGEDFLKLLKALHGELETMDIPADVKNEADGELRRAIAQAQQTPPDKSTLLESLKNIGEMMKNSTAIAVGIGKFWPLLRKAIEWLT